MWRPERNGGTSAFSSPMTSRPMADPGQGGQMPGDKDGVELLKNSAAGELQSPMSSAPVKQPGVTTSGAPTGPFQVTEDIQAIEGKRGSFPRGTGTSM
jgi:hypothetical protein